MISAIATAGDTEGAAVDNVIGEIVEGVSATAGAAGCPVGRDGEGGGTVEVVVSISTGTIGGEVSSTSIGATGGRGEVTISTPGVGCGPMVGSGPRGLTEGGTGVTVVSITTGTPGLVVSVTGFGIGEIGEIAVGKAIGGEGGSPVGKGEVRGIGSTVVVSVIGMIGGEVSSTTASIGSTGGRTEVTISAIGVGYGVVIGTKGSVTPGTVTLVVCGDNSVVFSGSDGVIEEEHFLLLNLARFIMQYFAASYFTSLISIFFLINVNNEILILD